jgi:ABC-2 type transport system permease protein
VIGMLLAVAKKDLIQFFRYPVNAAFRVIEPLMWLTPAFFLGQSFSVDGRAAGFEAFSGTSDFFSFLLIGSFLGAYINSVFWGIGYSLKVEMDAGVLETNWMAPVPRIAFLVGRTITSLVITTLNCTGVLLASWMLFGFRVTGSVGLAMLIAVPMLAGLYGFGFAFAGLVLLMRDANTLVDVSSFLVGELSGRGFPVTVLPRFLLILSLALPTTYGYDAVRALLLGTDPLLPLWLSVVVLVGFMVVMLVLGAYAFLRIELRCRARGTLGLH